MQNHMILNCMKQCHLQECFKMGRTISVTFKNGIPYDQDRNELISESRFDLINNMTDEERHQAAVDDPENSPLKEGEINKFVLMSSIPGKALKENTNL